MIPSKQILLVVLGLSCLLSSCKNNDNSNQSVNDSKLMYKMDDNVLNILSEKRIFFGHMSVGYNIMEGVSYLNMKNGNKLRIIETADTSEFHGAFFAHVNIGNNTKPLAKIDRFKNLLDNGIGEKVDIAFLKFCYIDINMNSDIDSILNHYSSTIDYLKNKYPEIVFVHFTVPLRTVQRGPKAFIKKLINKPVGIEENLSRDKYNRLLIKKFNGIDPIFDIAAVESTFPDGKHNLYKVDENTVAPALIYEYALDRGHLNSSGSKVVAKELLNLLSKL
jgi:hypothetical protein